MIARRSLFRLLERTLCVACGWYWFGASGAALAVLWLATRPLPPVTSVQSLLAALETVDDTMAHVTKGRVSVTHPRLGRLEVFRDEVSAAHWARLKRSCQPATGRSTSI